MVRSLLLLSLFFLSSLYASRFDNPHNHSNHQKIRWVNLSGERASGTKFVTRLIYTNFPSLSINCPHPRPVGKYGHKHFLPWFDAPKGAPDDVPALNHTKSVEYFRGSDDCLFVIVVRNPYDWLRSFYRKPHHVPQELKTDFPTFIRGVWWSQFAKVDDFNPWTGKPFENVLELRKYKNLNYLNLGNFVKNYLLVRYEDVRDHQQEFIDFIADNYGLQKAESFVLIDDYVGHTKANKGPFTQPKYFEFDRSDFEFINSHIDWTVEAKVGFYEKTLQALKDL